MGLEVLQCVHVQLQSFVVVAGIVFFHGLFHVFDGLFLEIRVHGVSLSAGGRPKDRFGGDTIAPARKQSTCKALVATSSPFVFHVEVDVGARAGFFRVRKGRLDRTFFSKGPFYCQDRREEGSPDPPWFEVYEEFCWSMKETPSRMDDATCEQMKVQRHKRRRGTTRADRRDMARRMQGGWMGRRSPEPPSSACMEGGHRSNTRENCTRRTIRFGVETCIPRCMDWLCVPLQHDTFRRLHAPSFAYMRHLFPMDVLPTILRTCIARWHRLPRRGRRSRLVTNETSGIQPETSRLCDKRSRLPETATTPVWNRPGSVVGSRPISKRNGPAPMLVQIFCPLKLGVQTTDSILTNSRRLHSCSDLRHRGWQVRTRLKRARASCRSQFPSPDSERGKVEACSET